MSSPERAFPALRRWGLLGALLLGAAQAQSAVPAPAQEPAICAVSEDLPDVSIGGVSRGAFSLRRSDGAFWLQQDALRPGEERYGLETVRCDDLAFTRLDPALGAQYDPEAQVVTFAPRLELLPTRTLAVSLTPVTPEGVTSLPLYALDYSLSAARFSGGNLAQRGYARASYTNGPWSAQLGVAEAGASGQSVEVGVSASARYQLYPDLSVEAGVNIPSLLTGSLAGFSGVQGQFSGQTGRVLDTFTVDVPLGGRIRLSSGGRPLGSWTVDAGRVVFRNVPLVGTTGAVLAVVEDPAGRREQAQVYTFPTAVLAPGNYGVVAEAGALGGAAYARGLVRYGLTPGLTLDAQVGVRAGEVGGRVGVTAASLDQVISVGITHRLDGLTTAATVDYGGRLGRFGLGLGAQFPLGDLGATRAAASVSTELGGFSTGLSVGYDPRQLGWYGGAQVTGALTRDVRLSAAGRVGTQSSIFSVTLGYQPGDHWRAAINTAATANGPAVRASATYQPTPDQQWNLAYGAGAGYAEYRRRGAAELAVGAGTGGEVNATLRGTLVSAAGRVYATAARTDDVSVVLETGVPGLAIYAGGLFQGRTDAAGTLVFSVSGSGTADVRVDVASLPIEIDVKEASLSLAGLTARAVKVDWRGNFGRSRVVDFQGPDGQDAAYGAAVLDGERYDLDAFGTALLPTTSATVRGELRLADGTVCPVVIAAGDQTVRCAP